ncbi:MAG: thermonuclease family protein, partial [bacterium]|nr:thermonuclease family protein [bacterium]
MKKLILIYIMISSIMFFPISVLAEEYAIDTTRTKKVTLEKCVDGDTANFKDITGRVYKTRFLAIDTRETVHPSKPAEAYGKEASTFTCESLTGATEIILETDKKSIVYLKLSMKKGSGQNTFSYRAQPELAKNIEEIIESYSIIE